MDEVIRTKRIRADGKYYWVSHRGNSAHLDSKYGGDKSTSYI